MSTEFGLEEGIEHVDEAGEPPRPPVRYDQSWLTSLLRPLLIVALVACLDVALGAVIARMATDLPQGFALGLVLLAIFAAGLGVVTTSVLAQPSQRANRKATTRAAEIALLLAAVRAYVWLAGSGLPSARQTLETPLETLFDPLFLVSAVIVGLSWYIASEITGDLSQLALTADEIRTFEGRGDRGGDAMRGVAVDRRAVLSAFTMRWATLGLVLILLAAIVRRGFTATGFFGLLRQDVEPVVMVAIIFYFVIGLVLISHGQLALLRARWTLEQTPSDANVTRRWPIMVLAVLGLIGLGAAFLPLGGTFALATVLAAIIGGVMAILMLLQRLFLYGVVWLAGLFSWGMPDTPPPPPPPPLPVAADLPRLQPAMPTWLGGFLFWVAVAALVGYAAWVYFHDRGAHLRWLAWLWAALRRRYSDARRLIHLRGPRASAIADTTGAAQRSWSLLDWFRRGPHGPDEEVRYLYLATLQAAEEAGVTRSASETPLHFAPRLEAAVTDVPEAAATAHDLTESFVEVRYARRHAAPERVSGLRARWEALRRALARRQG